MPLSVGHGFPTSEISNSTIEKIQHTNSLPHQRFWVKIKDFFCVTRQEEALNLILKLFHPEDKTTSQDVKHTWEQLQLLVSPGHQTCFGSTDSDPNINHFTIKDASLSITIDNDKYTIDNGNVESRFTYKLYNPEKTVNSFSPKETGCNTGVKTSTEIEEIYALKIQKYYSIFQRNLTKRGSISEEFTKMVYNGNRKNINGREYYLSKNYIPVYRPSEKIPYDKNEFGSFKHVTHKDRRFVALAANERNEEFDTANNFEHFNGLNSMKYGLVVRSDLIIARNAGPDLFTYQEKKTNFPLLAFKNAVNDLKTLHGRGVFLRDIKPENLAYDGKQVNFIDLDDRLGVNKETSPSISRFDIYGQESSYTPDFITTPLLNSIYKNHEHSDELIDKDTTHFLQAADEYALLLSMIEVTTYNKYINVDPKSTQPVCEKYLKSRNKEQAISWIEENIKPNYINSAKLLLTEPEKYAETAPNLHLADMLLFKE